MNFYALQHQQLQKYEQFAKSLASRMDPTSAGYAQQLDAAARAQFVSSALNQQQEYCRRYEHRAPPR